MSTSSAAFDVGAIGDESELYRSVSRAAVFSLLLGVLGIFAWTSPALIVLPIAEVLS